MLTNVLPHALAVYLLLGSPLYGVYIFRKAKERIDAGAPDAKRRLYRANLAEQIATGAAALACVATVPLSRLGLAAPRSWAVAVSVFVVLAAAVVFLSLRVRPMASKIRKQAKTASGFLLLVPDNSRERTWYGAVSFGAGISEELCYRGFLLYYLALYVPHFNLLERVAVAALFFGLAHLYQGWKSVAGIAVMGLAFVGLYLLTGSLLLPIAVHIAMDWRLLLMLPPVKSQQTQLAAAA